MSGPITLESFFSHPIDTMGELYDDAANEVASWFESDTPPPPPSSPTLVNVAMEPSTRERIEDCYSTLSDPLFQICGEVVRGERPALARMGDMCSGWINEVFSQGGVCSSGEEAPLSSVVTYARNEFPQGVCFTASRVMDDSMRLLIRVRGTEHHADAVAEPETPTDAEFDAMIHEMAEEPTPSVDIHRFLEEFPLPERLEGPSVPVSDGVEVHRIADELRMPPEAVLEALEESGGN